MLKALDFFFNKARLKEQDKIIYKTKEHRKIKSFVFVKWLNG